MACSKDIRGLKLAEPLSNPKKSQELNELNQKCFIFIPCVYQLFSYEFTFSAKFLY
jgi:hypothetical protein